MKKTAFLIVLVTLLGCKKEIVEHDPVVTQLPQQTVTNPEPVDPPINPTYMLDAVMNGTVLQRNNYDTTIGQMILFNYPDRDPSINFIIDSSVTVGSYNYKSAVGFRICFEYHNSADPQSFLAHCAFCGMCNHTGTIDVTQVRNDSIWAEFDLNIVYDSINGQSYLYAPMTVKGTLNGMPY